MTNFTVNGQAVSTETSKNLLQFLRDDLRLTSVKDGCSEGACGACTVLIDGKKMKACVVKISSLEGKSVITVEGLSEREKEVYSYCFGEAGAVQCGFCIPGMVISAKGLLDGNLTPSRDEIRAAIKGNICRCTGYVKIVDAIEMAARFFRENLAIPSAVTKTGINRRFIRIDAEEKVLGTGLYADDLEFPDMVYAKALFSAYPRAIVNAIDTSEAEKHPDCLKILTSVDVPVNKLGHIIKDWDVIIPVGGTTRFIGDAVALVASSRKETLDEILSLIKVDYTELEPIVDTLVAMDPKTDHIHENGNILAEEHLIRGDVDKAIAEAAFVVTQKYQTPVGEHAFMEPECAVALPEGDGVLVYTGSQSIYDEQVDIARMLKLPLEKVRCISMLVGGAFGGKEDLTVQHHAALMAWILKRPVKVKFSRSDSFKYHVKRHKMDLEFTTACDSEGKLTALKAKIISDTGAYASLGGPVLQRACTHAGGPYNYQNIDVHGIAVYTNNIPAGAFRGFGVTQSCFAIENNINLLAEKVGISPWEIRWRNAVKPGEVLPNGQIAAPNTGIRECLMALKDVYEKIPHAGIACAFKNSGIGVGNEDAGRCILSIEDGIVHTRTSAACMGQGVGTVCTQIVCETTGIDASLVYHERPDTARTPDSGTSTASRQTLITGEATRRASELLKAELDAGKTLADLEGKEFYGEFFAITDPMGLNKKNPVSHVGYGFGAAVVQLDEDGKVTDIHVAYDPGVPVNLQAIEGQIEGGAVMGMGMALTEDYAMKDGRPLKKYGTLGLLRATDVPEIHINLVRSSGEKSPYAYGAKGIGELSLIPIAPACSGAYYALDGKFRTVLPLRETFYKK